jgi:hypothetical protein
MLKNILSLCIVEDVPLYLPRIELHAWFGKEYPYVSEHLGVACRILDNNQGKVAATPTRWFEWDGHIFWPLYATETRRLVYIKHGPGGQPATSVRFLTYKHHPAQSVDWDYFIKNYGSEIQPTSLSGRELREEA